MFKTKFERLISRECQFFLCIFLHIFHIHIAAVTFKKEVTRSATISNPLSFKGSCATALLGVSSSSREHYQVRMLL